VWSGKERVDERKMEDYLDAHYDVVVLGTGVAEAMVARCYYYYFWLRCAALRSRGKC
jgi:hypothetical protein